MRDVLGTTLRAYRNLSDTRSAAAYGRATAADVARARETFERAERAWRMWAYGRPVHPCRSLYISRKAR